MNSRMLLVSLFVLSMVAMPAQAAPEIQPGLWEDTENGELNGQKQPQQVTRECISPEEAKDLVKKARADMQQSLKESGEIAKSCSKLDIQEKGNVITFDMKCGGPAMGGAMEISMVVTINSSTSMTSVAKTMMSFGGQKMTSNMTTQSKYVGPCKK